jgi:uroporphyrinogen-III synthase
MPSASRPSLFLAVRPEPEAASFAALLTGRSGLPALPCPVTRIRELDTPFPTGGFTTALLTSPRAVPAAARLGKPVLAVGERTAEAARAAGLVVLGTGPGRMGEELAALLGEGASVLHLAGEDVAADPAPILARRGIPYRRVTVYRAQALGALPGPVEAALRQHEKPAAAFLSARNCLLFAKLAAPVLSTGSTRLTAFCMSGRIAAAAARTGLFGNVLNADAAGPSGFVDFITARCT